MGSLIESSSSLEIAIAPDDPRPIGQLNTPDHALVSRELRPIAIHGIERFIDAGKAAEFVQLNHRPRQRLSRTQQKAAGPARWTAAQHQHRWPDKADFGHHESRG